MVDDDNQPLPENIPTPAKEGQDAPQFFSTWEHSGDCYRCFAGGCKHKACLSFNTDMKPTIQQLFKMFSSSHMLKGSSSLKPTYACKKKNIILSDMESSFIGWACGSSWQQSMVQIAQRFGPWVRLIVLLVPH